MITTFLDWFAILIDAVQSVLRTRGMQRWKRVRFVALFLLLWPMLAVFTHVGLALDHLLFPGFRKVTIERPLFIVGNLRTGSTFLHQMVTRDAQATATFRTVDLFLQPILFKRIAAMVGRVDAWMGSPARRLVERIEAGTLPGFRKVHDIRLFKPEEDDHLLFSVLRAAALVEIFPGVKRFRRLLETDEQMSLEEQDKVWAFYKSLVRRQLYHLGGDRHFVSKNPLYSTKLKGLLRAFPDARVILLVRNPLQTVPSSASLWHFVWRETGASHQDAIGGDECIALCRRFYDHPRPILASLGDRGVTLRYEDLMSDAQGVVLGSFKRLGLPVPKGMAIALDAHRRTARQFKSRHRYTSVDFGMSDALLVDRFRDIFTAYDYELPRREADVDAPQVEASAMA